MHDSEHGVGCGGTWGGGVYWGECREGGDGEGDDSGREIRRGPRSIGGWRSESLVVMEGVAVQFFSLSNIGRLFCICTSLIHLFTPLQLSNTLPSHSHSRLISSPVFSPSPTHPYTPPPRL